LTIGFREVRLDENHVFINGRPFYCRGFGMHEDSEIHGRGFDPVVMIKDLNMLEWMNGNCYRTTHYPYAEQRHAETDRRGIVVIAETPAVGLKYYTTANLQLHEQIWRELIARDRNHPSIIAWSLSNEPHTEINASHAYFKSLVDVAHSLDSTRPVTIVYGPTYFDTDVTADLVDLLCINRYYGWYIDMGYLETINRSLVFDLSQWKRLYRKPLIVTEYGADSIVGLTHDPPIDFSENYQVELMRRTHQAFDHLRSRDMLAGEMVWNFADFMTAQAVNRAVGNHKGMLTRNRQPKMAAYVLKERYGMLQRALES